MNRSSKSELRLGDLLVEFNDRLGSRTEPEILTLTEKLGFVPQRERFSKRLAIADTSDYKVIGLHDIAFNPYLLWANAIAQNTVWEQAIISPLYPTFRVRSGYSPRFVNQLLCGGFLRSRYDAISYGSVPRKRRCSVGDFLNIRIHMPLPPLPEQERIVKLLDEAEELRKLRTQADGRTAQLIPALFHEMFGDPVANPKAWRVRRLEDVVATGKIVTYGIVQAGPNIPNGIPYIRTGDLKAGVIKINGLLRTSPEIAASYRRSEVSAGDIVMSIRATVGTTALVPNELHGANLTQGTARISPGPEVLAEFLLWFIRLPQTQSWIQGQVKGSTFREITLGNLRQLPVLTPPLPLQKEFAQRVTEIREMESAQAASRRRLDDLFQSMLHRAFNGDL